ncbi:MAG: 2-succinyl-5-enolpyruvyl-6-hydroxy-3-cyclohexene-1-carboxylic-acid synthase [Actinomycetota bacterium]
MGTGDISLACATALIDELAAHGMRHACVSPGSRSTPLALALERHAAVTVHVHLDERSSAFFALGLAKTLRRPVAVACTSGTAAAELFPAVVEASQARVPLYLLTADRPPRLRGTGANQTIDQVRLFGAYPRVYLAPAVPASPSDALDWRRIGREAVAACGGAQPGPVHINCSFEEPLVPTGAVVEMPAREPGRVNPPDRNPAPLAADVERAVQELSGARGVVVAGSSWWTPPSDVAQLAERLGWPVLAEPTSGLRRPGRALAAGQALIGSAGFLERHRPGVVLQVGATPTTRAAQALVAAAERLVVVDLFHLDPDPERRATWRLRADPDRLARSVGDRCEPAPDGWPATWRDLDERARRAMDGVLDATDEPTELRLARDLAAAIPEGGTLFVGNSMPIRDLDVAMAPREGLRVLANRGASGIDGLVSTAMGVATAGTGPTFALIGDLSLLYDVGALLWNGRRAASDVVIVVPNNEGGAIFGSLGQRELPERDRLFVTPHDVDLGAVCAAAGVGHQLVEQMTAFEDVAHEARAAGGIGVIEVTVPSERSRRQRADVQAAVEATIAEN